ncbi:hypothetical protein BT69DRAFT_1330390 [Atractiella rhizophila]|nr:hypothetical protein BT69DRAFT_1330390 [Atractiella rhizophila]
MSLPDLVDPSNPYRIASLDAGGPAPTHYDLKIQTDLSSLTFSGLVEITLDVPKDTDKLVLHAAKTLNVFEDSVALAKVDESGKAIGEVWKGAHIQRAEGEDERLTVTFGAPDQKRIISSGKVKLGLAFSAQLGKSLMGFYNSSYKPSGSDKTVSYALTQFEPTAARQAFPCWDEPNYKATYSMSLLARSEYVALANMPSKSTRSSGPTFESTELLNEDSLKSLNEQILKPADAKEGEWTLTEFEKSPKVSTYLVTYAVGPFECLEKSVELSKGRLPLRHYATKDIVKQGQRCIDVTAEVLPHFEEIFDIPYPLPKLDTLSAHDFDMGAMEGWGLITEAQLYDEENPSLAANRQITSVQSHEVAHMWFGNIVTMSWWEGLWLNEAFATLVGEYVVLDRIRPEWSVWDDFITSALKRALSLDATRSSHPIEVECQDSNRVNQIFDSISYEKGGSVLRMLMRFIGEKPFLNGVSIYLKRFIYSNSETTDLWNAISEASGFDVASMMNNWTKKTGFPVITVEETEEGLKVRQNRFLSSGRPTPEEDETIWQVPLFLKTVDADGKVSVDSKLLLDSREKIIPLKDVKNLTYKLNADTTAFTVCYTRPERSAKLGEEMAKPNGFTFGCLGQTQSTWFESRPEVVEALQAVRRSLAAPLVQRLGFEFDPKEKPAIHELRALAIEHAALSGDEATVKEIQRRFAPVLENNDRSLIPGDIRTAAFGAAVKNGGVAEFEAVLKIFKDPSSPDERLAAVRGLCRTTDEKVLDRLFKMLLDPAEIKDNVDTLTRTHDSCVDVLLGADAILWKLGSSGHLATEVLELDHFNVIAERYKGNYSFAHFVIYSFNALTKMSDYEDVQKFFANKDTSSYASRLTEGLEIVKQRANWLASDEKDVEQWLIKNGYLKE